MTSWCQTNHIFTVSDVQWNGKIENQKAATYIPGYWVDCRYQTPFQMCINVNPRLLTSQQAALFCFVRALWAMQFTIIDSMAYGCSKKRWITVVKHVEEIGKLMDKLTQSPLTRLRRTEWKALVLIDGIEIKQIILIMKGKLISGKTIYTTFSGYTAIPVRCVW